MALIPITYDFNPFYPPVYSPATPFRSLISSVLNDELFGAARDVPAKWSHVFYLENFRPEDVKMTVEDGNVKIHARHVRGDDENGEMREVKRCVKIPDGVDQAKLQGRMMNDRTYVVEAPLLRNETEEVELKVESVPAITDGKEKDMQLVESNKKPFETKLDLSMFDPADVKVKRRGNLVSVSADHESEENGMKISRSYRREFTVPQGVDYKQIKCVRDPKGRVAVMAPKAEK